MHPANGAIQRLGTSEGLRIAFSDNFEGEHFA
jgi:hypothetical protein